MAAFSSIFELPQQHPFLLDSNSTSTINCNINICALLEEPNNANFISSAFYIQPQNLEHSTPLNNDSSSSSSSDHLIHSLTNNKNSMDSSSIVTHHYKCNHNLLTTTPVDNKRKSKAPSTCSNSAQSKDKREMKGKKQKKMKDNVGEEKSKSSTEEDEEKNKAAAGCIHVRARRGQATDSHSLAERVRRERISERMKLLQGLVPGCDKVTGKALMLDEIINYVQSLQNQVEFLSMKLACLNPMLYDSGLDLESLMVRADDHQPLPSMQDSSPTTASNYHHLLQNSAHSILLPHETQIPNVLPHLQGSRQGLWELDEHTQRSIMNQSAGFTNTFFSFH